MHKPIGEKLREARLNLGLSVQEISEKMIHSGFEKASAKTIYSWESGNSKPSTDYFLELCSIYKIDDIPSFFGYKKSSDPEPTGSEEKVTREQLVDLLSRMGYLDENGNLSDEDLRFLMSVVAMLDAWFSARDASNN